MGFATSARGTIGIEWELALVDPADRGLVPAGPEIVAAADDPRVTGEFLQNTIELVTGVHRSAADARAELRELLERVLTLAEERGLRLIGSGTHPFSRWSEQPVSPAARYRTMTERAGGWGRQLAIWGVHTHIGVDDPRRVVPIMHALLAAYPLLHAVSASSPFWEGRDTGFASHRAMLFQQLPTGGLPPDFQDWEQLQRAYADLRRTGVADTPGEIRWDVRPAHRLGTVETRVQDGAPRLEDLAAVSALTQVVVEHANRALDRGEPAPRLPAWYVRENKWRASRYGDETIMIENAAGDERPVREVLAERMVEWAPIAEQLGCAAEFAQLAGLLERGSGADRQRRCARRAAGSLTAVVDELIAELRGG